MSVKETPIILSNKGPMLFYPCMVETWYFPVAVMQGQ